MQHATLPRAPRQTSTASYPPRPAPWGRARPTDDLAGLQALAARSHGSCQPVRRTQRMLSWVRTALRPPSAPTGYCARTRASPGRGCVRGRASAAGLRSAEIQFFAADELAQLLQRRAFARVVPEQPLQSVSQLSSPRCRPRRDPSIPGGRHAPVGPGPCAGRRRRLGNCPSRGRDRWTPPIRVGASGVTSLKRSSLMHCSAESCPEEILLDSVLLADSSAASRFRCSPGRRDRSVCGAANEASEGDRRGRQDGGGVEQTRYQGGRGGVPFMPVSAQRQREAVRFPIEREVRRPAALLDPELL